MKITDINDVKIGHIITFRSHYNGVLCRKFYEIIHIENSTVNCKTLFHHKRPEGYYDTVIDNLFECSDDEVFSSLEDLHKNYPEEFI